VERSRVLLYRAWPKSQALALGGGREYNKEDTACCTETLYNTRLGHGAAQMHNSSRLDGHIITDGLDRRLSKQHHVSIPIPFFYLTLPKKLRVSSTGRGAMARFSPGSTYRPTVQCGAVQSSLGT
jgi:hypothetical protein